MSAPEHPLRVQMRPLADAEPNAFTLASIRFGAPPIGPQDARVIHVPLTVLGGNAYVQQWQGGSVVEQGVEDGIAYAHNGELLFGQLRLSEAELVHMDRMAFRSYVRIDRLLTQLEYPHWLRVWIYMAGITRGDGDAERYRQFSAGRHRALSLKPGFEKNLPAATAIGTQDQGLQIFFLASKSGGSQVENPRQVSAFAYPREYGPRSPSFSRATFKRWPGHSHLYISGTASIVGHASQHLGDAAKQLQEIATNIDALLNRACQQHVPSATGKDAQALGLKLYLRDPALKAQIEPLLPTLFGADTPIVMLQGDICRRDLLVEVEGVYRLPSL